MGFNTWTFLPILHTNKYLGTKEEMTGRPEIDGLFSPQYPKPIFDLEQEAGDNTGETGYNDRSSSPGHTSIAT